MNASRKIILRLCRYRNILYRFRQYGTLSIFSEELAEALSLTAAQVRKDFSVFKIQGRKKAGYRVEGLIETFNHILEKTKIQKTILVGLNPLGIGLALDSLLSDNNIIVVAAFGETAELSRAHAMLPNLQIYSTDKLISFVRQEKIRHAILTVTTPLAQRALDQLMLAGVRSVLSLSPTELRVPKNCIYNTVNLVSEFDNLIYFTDHPAERKFSSR